MFSFHGYLTFDQDQEKMKNGEIDLRKYEITKTLTKPPKDYPDAKNQPHVQVRSHLYQIFKPAHMK